MDYSEAPPQHQTILDINDDNYSSIDERTLILPKVPSCRHCGAYKFYKESELFCCMGGQISLVESVLPNYLVELITGADSRAKDFQNMISTYIKILIVPPTYNDCGSNYTTNVVYK